MGEQLTKRQLVLGDSNVDSRKLSVEYSSLKKTEIRLSRISEANRLLRSTEREPTPLASYLVTCATA
jgi:hypothetical protein